ncbi:MAG: hypothetical protein KGM42_07705 [Hyphomicrobiales bacterium]|nr:hypothetical protein [Hyphomicrobiales bacterium]
MNPSARAIFCKSDRDFRRVSFVDQIAESAQRRCFVYLLDVRTPFSFEVPERWQNKDTKRALAARPVALPDSDIFCLFYRSFISTSGSHD